MSARRRLFVAASAAVMATSSLIAAFPLATLTLAALPGERVLTAEQQALALEGMPATEREHTAALWADHAHVVPVAYVRAYFALERDEDGSERLVQVGGYDVGPADSALRLPNVKTAGSGTGGRYDMYMSVSIWRTSNSGVYEWGIETYCDWRKGANGADALCNQVEDTISTSWAGDLYLYSDSGSGRCSSLLTPIYMYRSDMTPNEGVGWSYKEWMSVQPACFLEDYARFAAYIRESTWKNRTDNVASQYLHSKGGTAEYTLSYKDASFTIVPANSNQWSAAAYTSFTH